MSVRVRFAPSPTGMLHVGALRDALFKQLFARHFNGVNILRIEDTDRTRYSPDSEQEFIDTLSWVGITFDEGPHLGGPNGPYRQSERQAAGIYTPWIERLLDLGHAYKAFETPEELTEMREIQTINKQPTGYFGGSWRDASPAQVAAAEAEGKPFVIRQKIRRDKEIVFEDFIRGRIAVDSNLVDDAVLIKADKMPTYHFASMVDDHLMGITHILRGEEWISSAPKHVELFDMFGWERPVLVHCPVIVGSDGKKLSKRHGATRVLDYAAEGYMKQPLKNFVALIGWSPGNEQEIFTESELIAAFALKGLQPSPGKFDLEKLKWLNGHAIRAMATPDLLDEIIRFVKSPFAEAYWTNYVTEEGGAKVDSDLRWRTLKELVSSADRDRVYTIGALALEQERVQTLSEFGGACAFFFEEKPPIEEKAAAKWLTQAHVSGMFETICLRLSEMPVVTVATLEELLKELQLQFGFEKLGPVVHPIRVALTGRTFGPGLYELMALLGKERIIARLRRCEGWK